MPHSMMEQALFKRLLVRAVVLPVLFLALLAAVLVWQVVRLLETSQWVDHTDRVIAQAQKTLKLLVDMESGQRGYLLSGQSLFLQPYNHASITFPTALDSLQRLVADNPQQGRRLSAIRTFSAQWADNARAEIALRQQGKDYRTAFATARGKRLMDSLRALFDTFLGTEEGLRDERTEVARQSAGYTLASTLGLMLVLGGILGWTRRRGLLTLSQSYERALETARTQADQIRWQAEILQASEEHLSTTLRSIGDAVIATDTQGQVTFLNPVAERLTGWEQDEARNRDLNEVFVIVNEETRLPVESPVQKVLREGVVVGLANHTLLLCRDGTETPIDDTGAPMRSSQGDLSGVVLVFHDITDRKQAENRLRANEEKFRLLFADHPHPMWVYDLETLAFLEVNEAALAQYDYSREEFAQMRITDIRPLEDLARLREDLQSERPALKRSGAWQHCRKNGEVFDVDITSHTLEFAGRKAVLVVAIDITERKRAEEALQRANEFRDKVLESAIMGVGALNMEGKFTLVNQRLAEIFGYAIEEILGQPFSILLPPEHLPRVTEQFYQTVHDGVALPHAETQIMRKDGARADVSFGWSPLWGEGKILGLVGTAEDITERKRLENQLLQAQKLESIGRLAGGIAHDFNNLLTVILGNTDLAEEEIEPDSPLRVYLDNTRQATERAADLTRQLLAFARRQVIAPKIINLNTLVRSIEPMLRRLIPENIQLEMLSEDGLHSIKADPGQFEQILVNLVVNARDAMPQGGKITIETRNATLDAEYAQHHEGVTPGMYVMLAVSDTGSGMDEAVKLHIFEPFFTTKAQGRGTGLGLATVYGIVKQAGGHIWLYSEPGEGTTFRIYLPYTAETPEEAPALPEPATQLRGSETLLLVEDDPAVRTLTAWTLRGVGYTVLEAENGAEALQMAQEHEGEISLLITDVVMPRMSGKQLADQLHAERPELKVLYSSGYTENTIIHHSVLDRGIAFLPKPFTPSALVRKVREILDNGTPP